MQSSIETIYFRNSKITPLSGISSICFGVMLILFSILRQFLHILGPENNSFSNIPNGVFIVSILIGINLLFFGIKTLYTPLRVVLTDEFLFVEGRLTKKVIRWSDVSLITFTQQTLSLGTPVSYLVMKNDLGKTICKIPNSFDRYTELTEAIKTRSAMIKGHDLVSPKVDHKQKVKEQNTYRFFFLVFGVTFTFICFFGAFDFYETRRYENQLENGNVVMVVATINHHNISRNRSCIEYEFKDMDGEMCARRVYAPKELFEDLKTGDKVTIKYIADNPDWSRLLVNDPESKPEYSWFHLVIIVAASCFALLVLTMGILNISDIKVVGGRLRVIRGVNEV